MNVLQEAGSRNGSEESASGFNLRWCFVFFVISGFCGLVYEVVWLRLAMASFGVTTALASIVISMFMAGLGVGSWGAGILTRRILAWNGKRTLRFYAIAELAVGVSSIAVPMQLKMGRLYLLRVGSLGAWQSSRYYIFAGIWIAITLVPWCTCMGSTFPLLMAVIRQTARAASQRSFSYLYVANVFGALLGTIGSAFVLIELFGFQGTLYVAGSLNAILAILAFSLSFSVVPSPTIEKSVSAEPKQTRLYGLPQGTVLVLLFTTGLVSMGLEVVWIRQFTPYLGNVVYAFAGILVVYLLATLAGSRAYRAQAESHSAGDSVKAWTSLAFFAVIPLIAADPRLHLEGFPAGGLRVITIVFFCAMAGFLTPLLVDSWSSGDPDRAGTAYAVNIGGSILGPLVAGFFLLPWLGERMAVMALSAPLFVIAGITVFRRPVGLTQAKSGLKQGVYLGGAVIAAILLFVVSQDYESRYAVREVKRDYTATVIATGTGFDRFLYVNGVGMTGITPITKYIAHLPLAFMAQRPQNGLVICFGMGTSFRSMLSWDIPTTSVDLIPSVPAMFPYYYADAATLTSSPLAHIVTDDGRRFLDGSSQTYDVIVIDPPPPPQAAGSSLLYSREFYGIIKQHLRKNGILQTWYPETMGDKATAASVAKALLQSFPYVRAFRSFDEIGIHFLASMEPIPATPSAELASRMPTAAAADFVEWGPKSTPQQQFEAVLSQELDLGKIVAEAPETPAMVDDQPINEYFLLRQWFSSSK